MRKADDKPKSALRFLSPFRYPGGKTSLRRYVLDWLVSLPTKPNIFVEPFAGGASVGLAVADQNLVAKVILIEKDPEVAAFWRVTFGRDAHKLVARIKSFAPGRRNVKKILRGDENGDFESAFRCLVRNRFQFGGVMAPGAGLLREGEAEHGIASRWYADTLCDRIDALSELARRVKVVEGDGLSHLRKYTSRSDAAMFIDPPYVVDGKGPGSRLYKFNDVEPADIFEALVGSRASWMVTYHGHPKIRQLAETVGFAVESIKVRTAHHTAKDEWIIHPPGIPTVGGDKCLTLGTTGLAVVAAK